MNRSFAVSPLFVLFVIPSLVLAACGDDDGVAGFDAGGADAGAVPGDGGRGDAGPDDAGPDDAGPDDAGASMDAAVDVDGGLGMDGGASDDGGAGLDADVGLDADLDADLGDGGTEDADVADAGVADAAPPDGGPPPGRCFANADCATDQLCAYMAMGGVEYSCTEPGVCLPRPGICPAVFDPVCGCDGAMYSNACYAQAAGIRVAMRGACP